MWLSLKMGLINVLNLKGNYLRFRYGDGSRWCITNNHSYRHKKKTNVDSKSNFLMYSYNVFSKNFIRGKLELFGSTDFRFTMGNPAS